MLTPELQTTMIADGFRLPIPAGTTFTAGDVVPLGVGLVAIAANDSAWAGNSAAQSFGNAVGRYAVPKKAAEAIAAGVKLGWNSTQTAATAVASTGDVTQYPLGISVAAATTSQTSVEVFLWPGSGLGS